MPVDDVAESDSLVPVFWKSFRRIVRCRVFEEPVSPRVRLFIRLQVFAGILLPLLVRIGYYRGSVRYPVAVALRRSVACSSEVSSGLRELLWPEMLNDNP